VRLGARRGQRVTDEQPAGARLKGDLNVTLKANWFPMAADGDLPHWRSGRQDLNPRNRTAQSQRHFRDSGWALHVPRSLKDLALRLERLAGDAPLPPTDAELADLAGVSAEAVVNAREVSG
jgi:hypothetical protein